MSDIIFYPQNILETGTVTVTGTPDTGFPESRLYDRAISLYWKDTVTEAKTFEVDQGATGNVAIDFLAIEKHNFNGETMRWQWTSDKFAEDTADYTESDAAARLALTDSTTVTVTDADTDEEYWLYRDRGAAFFSGDFEIHLTVNNTDSAEASDVIGVWALTNSVDSLGDIYTAGGDYLALVSFATTGAATPKLQLRECNAGSAIADESIALSESTNYYIKIKRDESVGTYGTLYCYIYSDAERTTLVDTLTLTLTKKQDFQYYFWAISFNTGVTGNAWDGIISDHAVINNAVDEWTQGDNNQIIKTLSSPLTKRYWRVTVTSMTDPKCSEIYMSLGYTFELKQNPIPTKTDVDNVRWNQTIGGLTRSTKFGDARKSRQYSFILSTAQLTSFETMLGHLNEYAKPFYIKDHDGNYWMARFVNIPKFDLYDANYTQVTIDLIEEL